MANTETKKLIVRHEDEINEQPIFIVHKNDYDTFFKALEKAMKQGDALYFAPTRCDGDDVTIRVDFDHKCEFNVLVDNLENSGLYLRVFGWNQFDVIKG